MKLDTTTLLVLLFVITRCKRGGAPALGKWVPQPDPEGYNVPVVPLPPNPPRGDR